MSTSAPELFARKASGIIRQGTPWRMFAFNLGFSGLTYVAMAYGFTPAVFPSADLILGIILASVGAIFTATLYFLFSSAMPRSGGDYVFLSRTLGPWVGYTINFVQAMSYTFWVAWGAYWMSYMILSGFFSVLGSVTGNGSLIDLGTAFASNEWSFVVGTVVIALLAVVTLINMKSYYRFQNFNFVVGMLGMAVILVTFLVASQTDFIARFNQYAATAANLQDGYQTIITAAEGAGLPASPGFSWQQTLGIFGIIWVVGMGTAYIGGEVKTVRKSQFIGMVGGSIGVCLIVLIVAVLMLRTVGTHFNAAANYLSLVAPDQYPLPVPPYYNLWVSVLVDNPIILTFMGLALVIWGYYWLPQNVIIVSRMWLAWSIDRVVPARISDVSQRFHTPHVAVILTLVLAELCLIFYSFTPYFLALAPMLPMTFAFVVVSIAGILFPFLKQTRSLYKASGVNYEIVGVPLFTIAGVASLIYWVTALYYELSYPELGLTGTGSLIFAGLIYALGIIIYAISFLYRRRQGIILQRAFKELPPE